MHDKSVVVYYELSGTLRSRHIPLYLPLAYAMFEYDTPVLQSLLSSKVVLTISVYVSNNQSKQRFKSDQLKRLFSSKRFVPVHMLWWCMHPILEFGQSPSDSPPSY